MPARSSAVNFGTLALYQLVRLFFASGVTVGVIQAMEAMPRPAWMPHPQAGGPASIIGWTLAMTIALDFGYYWMHRAQHRVPFLWAQHAVHHSDEHFNVTTAWRIHWTEPVLELVFMIAPAAYLFAGQPILPVAISVLSDALNAFAHLNVPMRWQRLHWWLNTPHLHRTHHSYLPQHIDRNYAGKFPIWDRLFGTYVEPDMIQEPPTGLHSGERILTVGDTAVYPFRVWSRLLREEPSAQSEARQRHFGTP